ncbi:SLATT domain-containing protein [Dyella japonica]|uniref:SLATT domain-containing protein n=1 Tax=Dyella japonica TaxID=231455 RepID=UPI00062D8C4C|nr:SLATT domain-containing protein [Dyella japonica]
MELPSPSDVPGQAAQPTLESQLREMYGRAAYTHKAHEKMADRCTVRYRVVKVTEIVLSAIASGSFLLALLGDSHAATIVGAAVSTALLGVTLYFKEAGTTRRAQVHTEVAAKLWAVREALLSLLVDMSDGVDPAHIRTRRDELNVTLEGIYRSAPRTDTAAYRAAQKALKQSEELFFGEAELDRMLPSKLRRATGAKSACARTDRDKDA